MQTKGNSVYSAGLWRTSTSVPGGLKSRCTGLETLNICIMLRQLE